MWEKTCRFQEFLNSLNLTESEIMAAEIGDKLQQKIASVATAISIFPENRGLLKHAHF